MQDGTERKQEVADDRAEPGLSGGFFLGADAVGVLRRALWGAAGAGGLGLLLLGAVALYLRELAAIGRAIEVVLRSMVK